MTNNGRGFSRITPEALQVVSTLPSKMLRLDMFGWQVGKATDWCPTPPAGQDPFAPMKATAGA